MVMARADHDARLTAIHSGPARVLSRPITPRSRGRSRTPSFYAKLRRTRDGFFIVRKRIAARP